MSPMVATYIGFVVAILILLWGVFIISRRYLWRGKTRAETMDAWIPLKADDVSTPGGPSPDGRGHNDETFNIDLHTRAQQNGHYSESKKSL